MQRRKLWDGETAEAQTDGVAFIFAVPKSVALVEMRLSEMNNCDFMLKHV